MAIYNYYKSLYNDSDSSTASLDFFKEAFSKCKNVVLNDSSTYSKIVIDKWNDLSDLSFSTNVSGTASNCTPKYITIFDIQGKEGIIIQNNPNSIFSGSNTILFLLNINGKIVKVDTATGLYYVFPIPIGAIPKRDKLSITKVTALSASTMSTQETIDISDYGLYISNGLVNQDSIYTDENGEEYVAINNFLLVKKSMMDE